MSELPLIKVQSDQLWIDLAERHKIKANKLIASEEFATYWMWAYPELLGWPREIKWLFSPVVGNRTYPGDLWGVDSSGNLLIIETKKGFINQNPFIDFVEYEKQPQSVQYLRVAALYKRWEKLYQSELSFIESSLTLLQARQFERHTASGILPYSSKRFATWNWPSLYTEVIAPEILDRKKYSDKVSEYLDMRSRKEDEIPYYFGLVLLRPGHRLRFSAKGHRHLKDLNQLVGQERVLSRGITAYPAYVENWTVEVVSWTQNFSDSS